MRTRDERIERIRKGIPDFLVRFYDAALKGKSRKMAIRAKCLDCCAWDRKEATQCPSVECPLYPYNPFLHRTDAVIRTTDDVSVQTYSTVGGADK